MRVLLAVAAVTAFAAPAFANDSTAQLGAGGLELVRNEAIELLSEDLYVSADLVKVKYVFRNKTDADVSYLVAFPLPALDSETPEEMNIVLPDPASQNFVDFRVTSDGLPVVAAIEERATALGVDRSQDLRLLGLPLNPMAEGLYDQLQLLTPDERDNLNRIGMVLVDSYGVQAAWRLDATFYWTQHFPAGKEVVIEHEYKPVVGFGFFGDYILKDAGYREKYCIDGAFDRAARTKLAAIADSPNPYLSEQRISYILTTANNWAGPIGTFRLVVDKGEADALVSFCGTGVKKIGPTQFEMTATDFIPEQELEILIAAPLPQ